MSEFSLAEYINMLGNANHRAANEYVELLSEVDRLRKALKKSCVCGEFSFIDDLCPACKALKEDTDDYDKNQTVGYPIKE